MKQILKEKVEDHLDQSYFYLAQASPKVADEMLKMILDPKVKPYVKAPLFESFFRIVDKGFTDKNFREDLFYRLNVIKIDVPPLRNRIEDITDLSKYFLKNYSDSLDEDLKVVTEDAMNLMKKYDWPGNVRQLENVCYWLTLMSPSQNVKSQDLPTEIKEFEVTDIPTSSWEDGMQNWLKNVSMNIDSGLSEIAITKIEKMLIKTALERSNGKKNDAAQILGWGRNTLSKKMKEHGI